MTINAAGLELIKRFEGCAFQAYQDTGGIWTIGYGHTAGVTSSMSIDQQQADNLLAQDVAFFSRGVTEMSMVDLNSNQFSALVSFAFNVGLDALRNSTLMRYVNERDFADAASQFLLWAYADGKLLAGLAARRQAERNLFLTPI